MASTANVPTYSQPSVGRAVMKNPLSRWLVTSATSMSDATTPYAPGVSRPSTSNGATPTSLHVSSCACRGPFVSPSELSQLAMPGPDRSARTWFRPWANMTAPTHTRATSNARFTASDISDPLLACRSPR
jgi:hypothetical protein